MSSKKLNVGDFGDDVARLHEKLEARGFEVSPEEVKRRFYGPATRDAVRECQTYQGLEATGEVNEATTALLLSSVSDSAASTVYGPFANTPKFQSPIAKPSVESELKVTATEVTMPGIEQPDEYHLPFPSPVQVEAQRTALSSLLNTSPFIASSQIQEKFIVLHTKHNGPGEALWSELRQDPEVGLQAAEEFKFTLELGKLTHNNIPLAKVLQAERSHDATPSLYELTKFNEDAWMKLVNTPVDGQPIPIQDTVPGETRDEKAANYVAGIVAELQEAFPTPYVARAMAKCPDIDLGLIQKALAQNPEIDFRGPIPDRIDWPEMSADERRKARASLEALHREINTFPEFDYQSLLDSPATSDTVFNNPVRACVSRFFANSPDFDLRQSPLEVYLAKHAAVAFAGIEDKDRDVVKTQVQKLQRVAQITSKTRQIEALLGRGLDSAYRIANMPRSTLMEQLGGILEDHELTRIHSAASYSNAVIMNIAANAVRSVQNDLPRVIGQVPKSIREIPNLTTLFGSLSFCECTHCRSVYSPTAYLVDLLHLLQTSPLNERGRTPLDVLIGTNSTLLPDFSARRPDLQYIKLTCHNTNTLIPYADLVNEVLESFIAYNQSLPYESTPYKPIPNDSSDDITSDELAANPENTNKDVYQEKLNVAVYPFSLPFNLPLEASRLYLEFLGYSRHDVMTTFQKDVNPATQHALDAEFLRISEEEYRILTGQNFDPMIALQPRETYEFYGYDNSAATTWRDSLVSVPEFLQRTGIAYKHLLGLLGTRFINPNPQIPQVETNFLPGFECDLGSTVLQRFDDAVPDDNTFGRMHRFIRLWRKLGWEIIDVDRMLTALKAEDTTPDILHECAVTTQLKTELNLPVQVLAALWADMDRHGVDSLYNKLFLNKAVLYLDPVFEPVLADLGLYINDHVPALLAALRIRESDLAIIREDAKLMDNGSPAPLNLATVTAIYRYVALAQALKIRISEFISIKKLSGNDPFPSPDQTHQFVALVSKVRDSGFKIAELDYLYRHVSQPPVDFAPQSVTISQTVRTLREGLRRIHADNVPIDDPRGEITRSKLAGIFENDVVEKTVRMLDGTEAYTTPLASLPAGLVFPEKVKKKIEYDKGAKALRYIGAMTNDEFSSITSIPQADDPFRASVQKLYEQPSQFIRNALIGFLNPAEAEKVLLRDLASLDQNGQPVLLDANDAPVTDPLKGVNTAISKKFKYFLDKLLPYLRDKLSRSLVKQSLGDALKLDNASVAALVENILRSQDDQNQSAVRDILALNITGLSASYFTTPDLIGPVMEIRVDGSIDFDGTLAVFPENTNSVRWAGKLLTS